jgi:exonuclease III
MGKSSEQKLNRAITKLTDVINQMDLTDIYRIFKPREKGYTFFLPLHRTFSEIDHTLGHKMKLKRYTQIEITSCISSNLYGKSLQTHRD